MTRNGTKKKSKKTAKKRARKPASKPVVLDPVLVPIPRETQRLSVDVPAELMEALRDMVVYLQRQEDEVDTLKGLVKFYCEKGLEETLAEYGLKKVPSRKNRILPQGRRIGG